jgi:hypothetical protein
VLALAGDADPVDVVTERARELVLEAMEAGWVGPPFNPFELAQLRQIQVVAREELQDARLVAPPENEPRIEYNPTRPRGRLRFSIAHELAHTFFPDFRKSARYRSGLKSKTDDWQLELLCDIAAAELLMPIGSFGELADEPLQIERLMELRRMYDVSTEALLLRIIKLTPEAAGIFAASRVDGNDLSSDLRIDYIIPSGAGWRPPLHRGELVSAATALGECTAVGYTAKGRETFRETVVVECAGIPPYPGQVIPRVIGLILPLTSERPESGFVELYGDAREPRGDPPHLLVHLVNDRTPNWNGAFANSLKERFPQAQRDFRDWVAEERRRLRLGNVRFVEIEPGLTIATMVAQHGYGPSTGVPRVRYSALRTCLTAVAEQATATGSSVHMPRIGTGGGGGDWRVIRELINNELVQRGLAVTVYGPPETQPPVPAQQALDLA